MCCGAQFHRRCFRSIKLTPSFYGFFKFIFKIRFFAIRRRVEQARCGAGWVQFLDQLCGQVAAWTAWNASRICSVWLSLCDSFVCLWARSHSPAKLADTLRNPIFSCHISHFLLHPLPGRPTHCSAVSTPLSLPVRSASDRHHTLHFTRLLFASSPSPFPSSLTVAVLQFAFAVPRVYKHLGRSPTLVAAPQSHLDTDRTRHGRGKALYSIIARPSRCRYHYPTLSRGECLAIIDNNPSPPTLLATHRSLSKSKALVTALVHGPSSHFGAHRPHCSTSASLRSFRLSDGTSKGCAAPDSFRG